MESYEDFRKRILKVEGKGVKKFKITNSYTIRKIYRWNKKHKVTNLDEKTYSRIIKRINQLLVEKFFKIGTLRFPQNLGSLYLTKKDTSPFINKEGKLVIPKLVDWKRTLQLWYEDPEAREAKILVRVETPICYKIVYSKHSARYKNKTFYNFSACRSFSSRCSRVPELTLLAVEKNEIH